MCSWEIGFSFAPRQNMKCMMDSITSSNDVIDREQVTQFGYVRHHITLFCHSIPVTSRLYTQVDSFRPPSFFHIFLIEYSNNIRSTTDIRFASPSFSESDSHVAGRWGCSKPWWLQWQLKPKPEPETALPPLPEASQSLAPPPLGRPSPRQSFLGTRRPSAEDTCHPLGQPVDEAEGERKRRGNRRVPPVAYTRGHSPTG